MLYTATVRFLSAGLFISRIFINHSRNKPTGKGPNLLLGFKEKNLRIEVFVLHCFYAICLLCVKCHILATCIIPVFYVFLLLKYFHIVYFHQNNYITVLLSQKQKIQKTHLGYTIHIYNLFILFQFCF
jgi:hypothetical protein